MTATDKFKIREIIEHIDIFGKNLTDWEIDFIGDLIDDPKRKITPKMETIINRIYDKKC